MLIYLAVLLVGLCVGSFLNVVIYRVPKGLEAEWKDDCARLNGVEPPPRPKFNIAYPASHCTVCQAPITPIQNIPLFSYLFLKGRCACCKSAISIRYPIVELLCGLLSLLVVYRLGLTPYAIGVVGFTWAAIALTGIDIDTMLLPDQITLPLVWAGLLIHIIFKTPVDLTSAVIGAAAGYLSLWSVYWLFKLIRNKEGMGYGDFKLLAAIGAWGGWQILLVTVLFASVVGAVIGILLLRAQKKNIDIQIPFGPYLCAGGFLALLYGREVNHYLKLGL